MAELLYKTAPASVNKSIDIAIETIKNTLVDFEKMGISSTYLSQIINDKDIRSKATEAVFNVDEFNNKLCSIRLTTTMANIYLHAGPKVIELAVENPAGRTMEILLQKDRTIRHEQFS